MPFSIIRNDITKVLADAIVNTANPVVAIGSGVDSIIYKAAGEVKLLQARKKIGYLDIIIEVKMRKDINIQMRNIMCELLQIVTIYLAASLLHYLMAGIGSLWNDIALSGQSKYAVFTFRKDVDMPMTKNILMNILGPNIVLVIYYGLLFKAGYINYAQKLWLFVPFYFLFRVVLICVILRRKELFNVKYEATIVFFSMLIELVLWKSFINSDENVFIGISELRNEVWLLIFVAMYKFVEMLIEKSVCQKNIVTADMMKRYVVKKFNEFFDKYSECLTIDYDNRNVCILLFAIMIFENYNRGRFLRTLENIKVSIGKSATVGIMQVKSNRILTNEESIIVAYNLLENEIFQEDKQIDDEMQIRDYAFEYNPDEDYARSVSFVYQLLKEYLEESPKYRKLFYLDVKIENEIEDTNNKELERNEACYLTLDDLHMMTGLKKKEILKIQRKNRAVILFLKEEVYENFEKYL